MSRIQLDIRGDVYIFPVNPVEYNAETGIQHGLTNTIGGSPVWSKPFYDNRKRSMFWRGLPHKSPYNTIYDTLKSAEMISGVRIKMKDLDFQGDQDTWNDIFILNVQYRYTLGGTSQGNGIGYDIDVIYTLPKARPQ